MFAEKFALTEHTTDIGREHPRRNPDAPLRFGRTPYRTHAPTTTEKHTVTYTRRPLIRYTLKMVFFWPSPGGPIRVRAPRARVFLQLVTPKPVLFFQFFNFSILHTVYTRVLLLRTKFSRGQRTQRFRKDSAERSRQLANLFF